MRNRRGFVLMEVLVAIALFALLIFYLSQASLTSNRYIDQSLDRYRGEMLAGDVLDTLQVEFQASNKISGLVGIDGTAYTDVPEEELSIKQLRLMQYKKPKKKPPDLKEFEKVITLYPEEGRKPVRFFHRESAGLPVSGGYEAATGVEELRIKKVGDRAYRLIVVVVAGKVKTEGSCVLTPGKGR